MRASASQGLMSQPSCSVLNLVSNAESPPRRPPSQRAHTPCVPSEFLSSPMRFRTSLVRMSTFVRGIAEAISRPLCSTVLTYWVCETMLLSASTTAVTAPSYMPFSRLRVVS